MGTAKSTANLSKSPSTNRDRGKAGEEAARRFLRHNGYRIAETNYRCPFGEVDIIALDGRVVVFVEVKSRTSSAFGNPEFAVDLRKQRTLSKVALHYLQERDLYDRDARFDVIALTMQPGDGNIHHIPDAFDLIPW